MRPARPNAVAPPRNRTPHRLPPPGLHRGTARGLPTAEPHKSGQASGKERLYAIAACVELAEPKPQREERHPSRQSTKTTPRAPSTPKTGLGHTGHPFGLGYPGRS
jgi:hypothetical protein